MTTRAGSAPDNAQTGLFVCLIAAAATGIAGYVGARVGMTMCVQPENIAVIWPTNAIVISALLLSPPRVWWMFILALLPAELLAEWEAGTPLRVSAGFFAGNVAEILIGASALRLAGECPPRFDTLRGSALFLVFAAGLGPLAGSFVGASASMLAGTQRPFWLNWQIWFLSASLASLALVPPIVLWARAGIADRMPPRRRRVAEGLLLGGGLLLTASLGFGLLPLAGPNSLMMVATPIPFLVWAAIRFGPLGTCTGVLLASFVALLGTLCSRGPFTEASPQLGIVSLQVFILTASAPILLLASLIQEARATATAARLSERFGRTLFETSMVGQALCRLDGTFVDMNRTCAKILGQPVDALIGQTWQGVTPPDLKDLGKRQLDLLLERGEVGPFETAYSLSDGSRIPVEVSATLIERGRERLVWASIQEISDRKRYEEALRMSEERIRQLFEEMQSGFALHELICDAQGKPADYRFLQINPAYERLTGLTAERIIGRTVKEELPDLEPYWIELFGRVALTGKAEQWRNYALSLGKHYEGIAYCPRPGQFAVLFNDISDRVRAEQERRVLEGQLRQAQKMEAVGQLAGGVAHDFNNLLLAITAYTDLSLEGVADDDPRREDLLEIRKSADRAATLVRQLLAFSRRQPMSLVTLDLNDTLADLIKLLRRVIGEHVELDVKPGFSLHSVSADPGQIEQVLVNLCVNARDALPKGGRIVVETGNATFDGVFAEDNAWAQEGEFVMLAVSDTGCGIPKEIQDRVMEPFFTTKEVGKGSGLGLSTVYGIVRQHNGFMRIESEPDKGTRVSIYLPAHHDDAVKSAYESDKPAPRGNNELILVAEDEPVVRGLAERALLNAGYRALVARDGEEAIAMFARHEDEVALAVLDVLMPRVNGNEVFRHLRARKPRLPVLFSTGYDRGILEDEIDPGDGVDQIVKPFRMPDMLKRVAKLLGQEQADKT